MDLLDPKNDYVLKRLFADSPDLLAALISAVRRGEPPVEVLQVLNPQILPQDLTGKAIELDVLARDARGRLFNVEVQVQRFPRWSARSAFYLSRLLTSQIDAGQAKGAEVIVYEPALQAATFYNSRVVRNLAAFKAEADVILANRVVADLDDVRAKVYSRDLFGGMRRGCAVMRAGAAALRRASPAGAAQPAGDADESLIDQ
jgi:predicted transposase/invertase (TIGR01784 family)